MGSKHYSQQQKLSILESSKKLGIKKAAEVSGVHYTSVYDWRRQLKDLGKDAFLAHQPKYPGRGTKQITKKQEKAILQFERNRLASETKAAYATGSHAEILEKVHRLQKTERKIGLAERALDDLLERMRPGSEHVAKRRTRDASLAIGKARLDVIADILSTKNISGKQERIKFITPRFSDIQGDSGGRITITLRINKVL